MRALVATATLILVISACGDSADKPSGTVDATATGSMISRITSATPSPIASGVTPAAPPPDEVVSIVRTCLAVAPLTDEAIQELATCTEASSYDFRAQPADGTPATLLIDARSPVRCFGTTSLIAWVNGGGWRVQSVDQLLSSDQGSSLTGATPPERPSARLAQIDGSDYIGIPVSNAECGSGYPADTYTLLRLSSDGWHLSWDSRSDSRSILGHSRVFFEDAGIDTLRIEGDSWFRQDVLSSVFREVNAGPHRYFTQTWTRNGGTYDMASEVVKPSPYNTLVEFTYAVRQHDQAAAARAATSASVADQAIVLLGEEDVRQSWIGFCGDGAITPPPCTITTPDGRSFTVQMVVSGDSWIVSDIVASE